MNPFLSWENLRVSNPGLNRVSYANCSNGKIIAIWGGSLGNIMHGYFDNYADMIGDRYRIKDVAVSLTFPNHQVRVQVSDVMGVPMLFIFARPDDTNGTWGLYLYTSPSGNGGDWTLNYTFYAYEWESMYTSMSADVRPSQLIVLPSGRWIFVACDYNWSLWAGVKRVYNINTCYMSDDQGVTWTSAVMPNVNGWMGWRWGDYMWDGCAPTLYKGRIYIGAFTMQIGGCALLSADADGTNWIKEKNFQALEIGFFTCPDGYLYGYRDKTLYRTRDDLIHSVPNGPENNWEYVSAWHSRGLFYILGNSLVYAIPDEYINVLGMRTMYKNVLIRADDSGDLHLGSDYYEEVETMESGIITKHTLITDRVTYSYSGAAVDYAGEEVYFLGSALSGTNNIYDYVSYSTATSRNIGMLWNNIRIVTFFYIDKDYPRLQFEDEMPALTPIPLLTTNPVSTPFDFAANINIPPQLKSPESSARVKNVKAVTVETENNWNSFGIIETFTPYQRIDPPVRKEQQDV